LSERVKYDTQRELEGAWFELDKLPTNEVTDVTIRIIARNHAPTSMKQASAALEENPGLYYKNSQPGMLLVDVISSVVANHIWEQLVIRFQQKLQSEEMERLRPQLQVAGAGTFGEPPLDELSAKRSRKKSN
jgi:hypothetical protein